MNIQADIAELGLTDSDRSVRCYAAESLGQAADIRAAEALCNALSDLDRGVRSSAAWALGRVLNTNLAAVLNLGDSPIDALCSALRDKNNERYVRCVAASALARTQDLRSIAALCDALNEVDMGIYGAAADSLVEIGDACILPLFAALQYANATVHIRVKFTLRRIRYSTPRLAERILCSPTLSVQQIVDTLQMLKYIPGMVDGKFVHDVPANLQTYCNNLCQDKGADESVKRGAEAVLAELVRRSNPSLLLRASQRGGGTDKFELLRGNSSDVRAGDPDEMLRASDEC